jgi:NMD protein affecting ribosome stability and mRNA decay
MKSGRGGFRPLRREQLLEGFEHDSYKSKGKLSDPTLCPECRATYRKGRWTWEGAAEGAREQSCPACQRIRDKFPAGYVSLGGTFFLEHRDQILNLVKHCEEKEKAAHPMQRLMAIEETGDGVLVTTTDVHLARNIAERVHDSYKGDLAFHYNKEDNLLRANWKR